MTALPLARTRFAVRRRRTGWLARLPGGIVAALRVALIYGEAERLCPPASACRAGRGDQLSSPPRRHEQRLARS
jgi:hypothetical protein